MIVRENIEFKRGIGSKEALGLGFQGLPNIFAELLETPGLSLIEFEKYGIDQKTMHEIDYIAFQMPPDATDIENLKN